MSELAAPVSRSGLVTVLASRSPARLQVLRAAGIDPAVVVSDVDEQAVLDEHAGNPPNDLVARLALAKAEAVAARLPWPVRRGVVIGCDSMLLHDGRLTGKPGTTERARQQWAELSGSTAELLTGHAVLRIDDGEVTARSAGTEVTQIRFGTPTPAEIDAYLATGEPLQVAGSLTIDGFGGWFVTGVNGDPSSVIGISLPLTRTLLSDVDIEVTDLWRPMGGNSNNLEGTVR
ncbi:Maf family protein [Nakamurella aerolata]|uniref:Maf family protein n=1 Tax=Nakamurella aerolata TaxID=1656892 RepID=UPI003CCDBE7D